jgi:hypothetical protein
VVTVTHFTKAHTHKGLPVLEQYGATRYLAGVEHWLAPAAAVKYLKSAPALASYGGLGMAIAQLDLSNRPISSVNLPKYYRRSCCDPSDRRSGARCLYWKGQAAS